MAAQHRRQPCAASAPAATAAPSVHAAAAASARLGPLQQDMIKVINLQLNDDRHRKLEQILDATQCLHKICCNIRILNATFQRHVRDAPRGAEFLQAAGWTAKVLHFDSYFVFEHQPGGPEWRLLGEACTELAKLAALLEGKIKRGMVDKRAEQQAARSKVLAGIEEDKMKRAAMFRPVTEPARAQPLPRRQRGQRLEA
ncbi:hypothetical protein ABPG75_010121 [Micractinium tetrahymenae]